MERLTNKKIIDELLPIMKEAIKKTDEIEFDDHDWVGHPLHLEYKNDITISWTKYEKEILVAVNKPLKGRYDHADLGVRIATEDVKYGDKIYHKGESIDEGTFCYSKEYSGMGNGFYAIVDNNGKIIKSEWD